MKKVKRIKIPASVTTVVTFCCESPGCEGTFDTEEELAGHVWEDHDAPTVPVKTLEGGTEYRWFDNPSWFERWANATAEDIGDFTVKKWRGAGWYRAKTETRPCGRGCCHDTHVTFVTAEDDMASIMAEIKGLEKKTAHLTARREYLERHTGGGAR